MQSKKLSRLVYSTVVATLIFGLFSISVAHENHFNQREPVCLQDYPTDPSFFKDHVRPYVSRIIERHGFEEWKAVLLTNELHRHLGMWSIIGAKMGIKAREILNAPFDQMDVISFCGF